MSTPSPKSNDRLLIANEVAQQLKISRAQVYTLAANGSLRHVRIGRIVRFPADAIEELLAASMCGGASQ